MVTVFRSPTAVPSRARTNGLVRASLAKAVQECQNGLVSTCHVIDETVNVSDVVGAAVSLGEHLAADLVVRERGADLRLRRVSASADAIGDVVVISAHRQHAPMPVPPAAAPTRRDALALGTLADALRDLPARPLADQLGNLFGAVLDAPAAAAVRETLERDSWLVQTLASDLLNRHGDPTVPPFLQHVPALTTERAPTPDGTPTERFEARITVDEYALFEAVHPAYGLQVLRVAQAIERRVPGCRRVLDVGSGPGLPTVMLAQRDPRLEFVAVEPSPAAYAHLCTNARGHRIVPVPIGIEEYDAAEPFHAVISIGASHHLDTRQFLRACVRNVATDGVVVVADEMIAPYRAPHERNANLVRHHLAYIEEALACVRPDALPSRERDRLTVLRDLRECSPYELRDALAQARIDRRPHDVHDVPWARVRLAVLELEALVAGLDYDVERKTYPLNFLALAEDEGFALIEHERVYGTDGSGEFDGGTHILVLAPPGAS
jgi:SAM-dependent methyltransferase